ncbi:hypothetical protein K7472_31025 [Streptomyces sp. PTM05]|uniref:Uncharacterized protein n=1 Tax=Streptantibioticus parmotrematis TaxID=2873249 RepID=A0ABS7R1A8_9ACTN|nr:hypothetical protein [Streptantibioticus parmotrematis]MBY8889243.1 hypothetical protein [Streptantibioticus parmotrematis]
MPSSHLPDRFARLANDDHIGPILELISREHRSVSLIAGGYFESAGGIGNFSRNSFALAHKLGASVRYRHRGNKVLFDVIHNDLGRACGDDACSVNTAPAKPGAYDITPLTAAAAAAGVTFTVTRERTLRNRAARSMKQWLKDPSVEPRFVRDGDDIYYRSRQYEKVLAGAVKDNYVVPRCPLIVNEYFIKYFARMRQYSDCTRAYVIDINSFADKEKVTKGAEIYLRNHASPTDEIILVFADPSCTDVVEMAFSTCDF